MKTIKIQITNGKTDSYPVEMRPITLDVTIDVAPKAGTIFCLDPDQLSKITKEARAESKSYLAFDKYYEGMIAVDSMYNRVQYTATSTLIVTEVFINCTCDPNTQHTSGHIIARVEPLIHK